MFSMRSAISFICQIQNCIAYSFACISALLLQTLFKERVVKNTRNYSLIVWFLCCAYMCPVYTYVCFQFLIYLGYCYYSNYVAPFYVPSFVIKNSYLYNSYINTKLLVLVCAAFSLITSVCLIKFFYQNYQKTYQYNHNDTRKMIKPVVLSNIYIALQTISFIVFVLGLYFLHSFSMQLGQPEQPVSLSVIQKCLIIVCCIILSATSYFYNINRSILVMSTDKDNQGIIIHSLASVSLLCAALQIKYE